MSFLGARAVGGVVSVLRGGVVNVATSTPNYTYIMVTRDGAIQWGGDGGTTTHIVFNVHPWHRSRMATIGDGYWVRFTRTSGDSINYRGDAVGVWHQLNTTRSFGYDLITESSGVYSGTYTIEIATSSGGAPIVAASSAGAYQISVQN